MFSSCLNVFRSKALKTQLLVEMRVDEAIFLVSFFKDIQIGNDFHKVLTFTKEDGFIIFWTKRGEPPPPCHLHIHDYF